MTKPVVLNLTAWAGALQKISQDAEKLPIEERSDEAAKPFKQRSMRLVLEFVDAIGDFELARSAAAAFTNQIEDAIVYRWPQETVEAALKGIADARAEGGVRAAYAELMYGDNDPRAEMQARTDEVVAKVTAVLGEDDAAS